MTMNSAKPGIAERFFSVFKKAIRDFAAADALKALEEKRIHYEMTIIGFRK